jgi:hypothetical protein
MLLPREQALRFINGYKPMLLRMLANTGTAETGDVNADLAEARSLGKADPRLFDTALRDLANEGNAVEPAVVAAIRSLKVGLWFYLRQAKTFAVFLDKEMENAYAVQALTTPLDELLDKPPFAMETGVVEFEGQFVCDGLALNPVLLGPGYRAQLNAAYSALRKSGRFHVRAIASQGAPSK